MAERLPDTRPQVLDLPMSRTDIADHLGLTIETVCRVLAHLRREGTVAVEPGRITIRDGVALAADGVGAAALSRVRRCAIRQAESRNATINRFQPLIATTAMVRSTSSRSLNSARANS